MLVVYQKDFEHPFKFSIVIAVYNVEAYIEDAIESIICQDIGFESSVQLILVDDGSTDRSGMICDEYLTKYPRNIHVIHKKNGGVSSARNEGICHVQGQYVNFMDADDKLTSNTLTAVYEYFSQVDKSIPFVSIPIWYFEQKNGPHRLNYKFKSGKNQIIDLNTQYNYVQMSIASSFIRYEVLTPNIFDTSLRYAEDAKVLMELLLHNPRYGIVPAGRYMYRARNSMDSALNGSKQHKEWYLDCLKDYIFWALDKAEELYGYIPQFVQFNVMYDLQGRFKVDEIPENVLTSGEKKIFLKMLFDAVFKIDDHIILEQKNISRELKDYIISIKKVPDSGELVFDDTKEDVYFHYSDLDTYSASSYLLRLNTIDGSAKNITINGSAKIYLRFPYPSKVYLRITSSKSVDIIECCFQEDEENVFRFDNQKLAVFLNFSAVIPDKKLADLSKIEFCMDINGHPICFKNIHKMSTVHVSSKEPTLKVNKKKYFVALNGHELIFKRSSLFTKFKSKIHNIIRL